MNSLITEIDVNSRTIRVMRVSSINYISLTDLARYSNSDDPSDVIKKWMSNHDTIEFLGLWEELFNKDFNLAEFRRIKNQSVKKSFVMTPRKWKRDFNVIGIIPSSGRYSIGTFAHPDIAFEFASWIDTSFKLYLIKEFERLKKDEAYRNKVKWEESRLLTKINYSLHTSAISKNIVPNLTEKQKKYVYAEEADILNVALIGMTAKEWRDKNPNLDGNIRDSADIIHLIILNNLEVLNSELIKKRLSSEERLVILNNSARDQMNTLLSNNNIKKIELQ